MARAPFYELRNRLLGGGMTALDDALADVGIGLIASAVVPVIDVLLDDEEEPVAMIVAAFAGPRLSSLRELGALAVRVERVLVARIAAPADADTGRLETAIRDARQAQREAVRAHVQRWPEE